jgi:hypothetical protein
VVVVAGFVAVGEPVVVVVSPVVAVGWVVVVGGRVVVVVELVDVVATDTGTGVIPVSLDGVVRTSR